MTQHQHSGCGEVAAVLSIVNTRTMKSTHATTDPTAAGPQANTHIVHSFMHFVRIVRYRQNVVVASVVVSVALCALYYATATRYYESTAGILVMQTGNDVNTTRITPEGARQGLMPTYERIIRGSEVLEAAVEALAPEHRIDLYDVPREKWAQAIRNNLLVKTVRHSNVIEVTYRSRTAETAAEVVRAIVDSYLLFMRKANEGAASEIHHVLTQEKVKADQRLQQIENEVLIARQQVLDIGPRDEGGPLHPAVEQAVTLSRQYTELKMKRIALESRLRSVQASVRTGGDLNQHLLALEGEIGRELLMAGLGIGSQDAVGRIELEKRLLRDQAELDTLLQTGCAENHPKVKEVANRMRVTQKYLGSYQQRVNQRIAQIHSQQLGPLLIRIVEQNLVEIIRHENALAQAALQAQTAAMSLVGARRRLEILEKQEATERQLRDGLIEKIAQIDLTRDQGNIRTRVTDMPKVLEAHVWPRLSLVGLFALTAGLAVGVAIVSVLDVLDDRFRSPEELHGQLDLPVLALVRQLPTHAESGPNALQMHVAPDASESEAFRTLRTAITFSGQESDRIVVSSAEPGDGKTTVLANLAVTYARAGKRTLLIDADMRRPGLTKLLECQGRHGLTQLLQGTDPVAQMAASLVRPTGIERLDLLPSGPRQANPAELLAGPRLPELLAWAESVYDQIVIDAPPAAAAVDASIIGAIADGLILVVRPEKNRRQAVVRAVEGFRSIGLQPRGVVVNGLAADSHGYYAYDEAYGYGAGESEADPKPDIRPVGTVSAGDAAATEPAPAPIVPRRAA